MKELNTPPLPQFRNPLKDVTKLQKELVESMATLSAVTDKLAADQAAMGGLLSALIATHPRPDQLLEGYLLHMDSIADMTPPAQIEKYRQAMQPWKDALLTCMNQRQQP